MSSYVLGSKKSKDPAPIKVQHSPYQWIPKHYGTTVYLTLLDTTLFLPELQIPHIQHIIGYFLYYCRAVDSSINPVINKLVIR